MRLIVIIRIITAEKYGASSLSFFLYDEVFYLSINSVNYLLILVSCSKKNW